MFERYTERSRRVIFFARYEALQYGSPVIAPEHILLGLLREDKSLGSRYFPGRRPVTVDSARREVEERIVVRDRIPQSAELHLSPETKRSLFYAGEESRLLKSRFIGSEHILLGLAREEGSVAAEILFQFGLRLQDVRDDLSRQIGMPLATPPATDDPKAPSLSEFTRDLTLDAAQGKLDPLIGREEEIGRLVEILCRRTTPC
jgi:ATP-dependent Clp protease ATP-binding subunit ClpC